MQLCHSHEGGADDPPTRQRHSGLAVSLCCAAAGSRSSRCCVFIVLSDSIVSDDRTHFGWRGCVAAQRQRQQRRDHRDGQRTRTARRPATATDLQPHTHIDNTTAIHLHAIHITHSPLTPPPHIRSAAALSHSASQSACQAQDRPAAAPPPRQLSPCQMTRAWAPSCST
jgi:hypothetical protein